jgi:hypothetical protein
MIARHNNYNRLRAYPAQRIRPELSLLPGSRMSRRAVDDCHTLLEILTHTIPGADREAEETISLVRQGKPIQENGPDPHFRP